MKNLLKEHIDEILYYVARSTKLTRQEFIDDVIKMGTYIFYEDPLEVVAKMEYLKPYEFSEIVENYHPPYDYESRFIFLSNKMVFEFWIDTLGIELRDNKIKQQSENNRGEQL